MIFINKNYETISFQNQEATHPLQGNQDRTENNIFEPETLNVPFRREYEQNNNDKTIKFLQDKMGQLMGMFEVFLSSSKPQRQKSETTSKKDASASRDSRKPSVSINLSRNQMVNEAVKKSIEDAKLPQMETRDKHPLLVVPKKLSKQKLSRRQLEQWLTSVCSTVFSISFNYFLKEELSFEQTKIFCSESILMNLLRLTEEHSLTIKQMRIIDDHIKLKVLPYMKRKFPLTLSFDANRQLEKEVNDVNHIDLLENDYLYTFNFMFEYRESGNYSDNIMKLMNQVMEEFDEQSEHAEKIAEAEDIEKEEVTNFKDFEIYMTKMFEKAYDEDWMLKKVEDKEFDNKLMNAVVGEKNIETIQLKKAGEKKKEEYKEKVKEYTQFVIGRKFEADSIIYSESQIKSRYLKIKNPAFLRILTKWCQELWLKFKKDNYFRERAESIQLQKPEYINPMYKWMRTKIDDLMAVEKVKIEQFMEQLQKNCYDQQALLLLKSLKEDDGISFIPKLEKAYGKFSIQMVNNFHNYIILYLNRLIHGLLTVSKTFHHENVKGKGYNNWPVPPNLISFTIGDFIRCKCSSKEKQIIKIFNQIKTISKESPQKLKIIRIKNRLHQGTNDILINVKFNNMFLCEIQLSVKSSASNFIKCSNYFNHYIYELERSRFGPILQLCSIWHTFDSRSFQFQKLYKDDKIKKTNLEINFEESCKNSQEHKFIDFSLPFECSKCKVSYFHNNYIITNKKCKRCLIKKCVRCQIQEYDQKRLKKLIFKTKKLKLMSPQFKKVPKGCSQIPKYGACVNLSTRHIELELFKYSRIEGRHWLLGSKDESIYEIKKISSKKDTSDFMSNYCIFEYKGEDSEFLQINDKIVQKFIVEEYLKSVYNQEKEVLILTQINPSETEMKEMIEKYSDDYWAEERKIKKIEFASNNMSDISFLHVYQNVTSINLDFNNIQHIQQVCAFQKLEKLEMRDNLTLNIDHPDFFALKKLREIQFKNCKLSSIPPSINKLLSLREIKLNVNNIEDLPFTICDLKQLTTLQLNNNKLKTIPDRIGELTNLCKIVLSQNYLKELPASFEQLENLELVELNDNDLTSLPKMGKMKYLERLFTNKNNLSELPPDISLLENLLELDFSFNKVESIPDNISRIKYLTILNTENNRITHLPEELGDCAYLQEIYLKKNKIEILPESLSNLKESGIVIDASYNKLIEFPECLLELESISELDLSNNQITSLPEEIEQIYYLERLCISNNKIRKIPERVKKLVNLQYLELENLEMEGVDEWMEKLILDKNENQQIELKLNHNRIKQLNLDVLQQQGRIELNHNLLTAIPVEMDMLVLTHLTLRNNLIALIPRDIQMFDNLTHLDLTNNLITLAPIELVELKKLSAKGLAISGNPIQEFQCEDFVAKNGDNPTKKMLNQVIKKRKEKEKEKKEEQKKDKDKGQKNKQEKNQQSKQKEEQKKPQEQSNYPKENT